MVGVLLDADLLEMRFFVNGTDQGVAFTGYQVSVLCIYIYANEGIALALSSFASI